MKIFRLAFMIGLFVFAYYAGLRHWGYNFLSDLLVNMNLQEILTSFWEFIVRWFSDQELGAQLGEKIENLKDTLSK